MTDHAIQYTIVPVHPEAHLFEVTCTVSEHDPDGQRFSLPVWIPGSYMVREFARNIVTIEAQAGGRAVRLDKLDKCVWQAAPVNKGESLTLRYEVYAWDLSVRAAHLDPTHAFFNGTSVFLAVEGQTDRACVVDIRRPAGRRYGDWRVATTLPPARGEIGAARQWGFGVYRADDYDALVDHPVEMGDFTQVEFQAGGAIHEIVLTGSHDCDTARLCHDLAKICTWQIDLFGCPAPIERYLFMTMLVGEGYGGLEHRSSTALLASRKDLPWKGMSGQPDGYVAFLGLCSHEYFHTWNVKRIKPAAFIPYDLSQENYTRLLWVFEGFTSYYDDLALVRSGVIGVETYLGLLGKTISSVLRGSGRFKQSVAESSFDAWTKYYRQDENAPNAIVSYYAKGALIALALDLRLRADSDGKVSLDDLMRLMWQRHGLTGVGVEEDGIFTLVAELAERGKQGSGRKTADWLRKLVNGTEDLPLQRSLKAFGVAYRAEATLRGTSLGVKLASNDKGEVRLANVFDQGPAQTAGLSAGDVLIALNGLKISTASGLEAMLERHSPGERIELYAFRRDELMSFDVELTEPPADKITLTAQSSLSSSAQALRKGWLGR